MKTVSFLRISALTGSLLLKQLRRAASKSRYVYMYHTTAIYRYLKNIWVEQNPFETYPRTFSLCMALYAEGVSVLLRARPKELEKKGAAMILPHLLPTSTRHRIVDRFTENK